MWDAVGVLILLGAGGFGIMALRVWCDWRHRFTGQRTPAAGSLPPQSCLSLWPDCWLAVKSRNLFAVQAALGLHNPRPCSWLEGFTNADRLFVAPPVKGWILVTGRGLPSPSQDVDVCFRFVLDLSRQLGQVQLFSANRESQHHAWVRAQDGRIVRAYAWAEMTLWQQGPPTRDETALGLQCLDYAEAAPGGQAGPPELLAANVEKVPLLAAHWGLDPAAIPQHFPLDEQGITGKAAHRY